MDKDVLLREYDAQSLAIMNSGDLYEVNFAQGTFNNSITALNSVYDGYYPLT